MVFWLIVEKLCLYGDYMMPYSAIPNLARKYSTPPEKINKINKIINDYDLKIHFIMKILNMFSKWFICCKSIKYSIKKYSNSCK